MDCPTAPAATSGVLNPFAAKQTVSFAVVALSDESSWKEKTLVCRLLLHDGSQTELHLVKEAKVQWEAMGLKTTTLPTQPYTVELARSTIRPYKNAARTGIQASYFIRLQFRLQVQRAVTAAQPLDRTHTDPSTLESVPYGTVVNVAGSVLALSPLVQADVLPKRTLDLQHGDFQIAVTLLGSMAKLRWEIGALAFLYGCVKREYQGLTTLETTRLAWRVMTPPWLQLADSEAGTPPRKALRRESLQPLPIADLLRAELRDVSAKAVEAIALPVTEHLFSETLWIGTDRFRLPLTLQDTTGQLRCTWWSQDWNDAAGLKVSSLSTLFDACGTPEGKEAFLSTLNTALEPVHRWVLRPKTWRREDGTEECQWHVVSADSAVTPAPANPLMSQTPAADLLREPHSEMKQDRADDDHDAKEDRAPQEVQGNNM